MHRRDVFMLFGAVLAAPFALSAAARACGPSPQFTKPIAFGPGRKEATIHNALKGDFTHEWIVKGHAGQKVEIKLEAKKSGVTLMPDEANGAKPKWGNSPKDGSYVKHWAGTLPKSGRMLIEVSTEAARDNYTLMVKLV